MLLYLHAPPSETQLSLVDDTFKRSFGRSTAHIAHIIPSFSVAMSDSKSTVSKTDSMCPLDMVEFPAGNQNSDVLLAWGKLCRINSLKPPFEHMARAACFSIQLAVGRSVLCSGDVYQIKKELRSGRLPYFVRSTCHEGGKQRQMPFDPDGCV